MMNRRNILLMMLIAVSISSYAQKSKKDKQELVIVGGKVLTHEDSAKVIQYYYSGLREKVVQNQTLAIDYFNQVLKIDEANHNAYYELAQIYFKKGDLGSAKEYAQKATAIKTDNEWYWLLLANIYQEQQDYTLLIYALDELIKIAPDKLDYSFDKANALFMIGKVDEALVQYNALEKLVGLSDQVLLGRQKIFLKKNQLEKAAADLEQVIKNNPSDVRYYLFLGDLYYANDKVNDALIVYQKALVLDGNNPFTRLAIAQIYDIQKKPKESFEQLKIAFEQPDLNIDQKVKLIIKYFDAFPDPKALEYAYELSKILIKVHSNDPKSYSLYGDVLFQRNELKEAKLAYEKAISLNNNVYAIWDQLLRIQLTLNDIPGLIKNGEEALTLFPNQFMLYFYTALGYIQNKEYDKAISYLNNTLNFDVNNASLKSQIYSSLGDAYQQQKKYNESVEAYESALLLEPNNTYTLNNYAYYLSLRDEKLAKAEAMSFKTNELEKDNASFQDTYAWILYKEKKYQEAKVWMQKAILNNPNSAVQFDHFGDILFRLGEIENAVQYWKKALVLDPENASLIKKMNQKRIVE
jgi:tetratricopeptide (TPR) repeat protein